jgi:phosphoserine phosphatase RsbU/P
MATLRAFLHGQTLHAVSRPSEIVRTLNQLLCGSFSTNRFATFFYGQVDTSTHTLRYVNAGHPPPLVYRTRDGRSELLQLREGGPVVGLIPGCKYAEGRLALEADDLFVAVTDGITEAMNDVGDEWGDEALARTIRRGREASPRAVIDRIMCGADAFAAGASQHDDMTVVAMRVLAGATFTARQPSSSRPGVRPESRDAVSA